MTAPVFFLRPLPDTDRLTLDGAEGRHASAVRRLRVGERVDITDGAGQLAECVVAGVGRGELTLDVLKRSFTAAAQPHVTIVQALVKGERSELAVELLTEVGVDEIVPWTAARCVATWAPDRSGRRWEQAAAAAAKQARRARWPVVAEVASTADVERRLSAADAAFVLHEGAGLPLASLLKEQALKAEVVIVVGPEGGLTDEELAGFAAAGAQLVQLGPSVLRASTAGCAAAALVMGATSRWS